jgi:CRISPR/Cas system-associated exonuclease Cas4 (RecB family)
MQLSYNKLQTFSHCALKYRLAYVERLPRAPLPALAFHRRVHAALCKYHFFAKRDGTVQEVELLAAYAQICGADQDHALREKKSYREGEDILRRYCESENQKGRVPAYLEHTLTVAFGPYTLTGKIDRLDFTDSHRYSLVDYKLDRKLPARNEAETSRQLSFYHLLVSEGLGVETEEVRLYYLRHGVEQVSVRSRRQIRELVDWMDETAGAIHKEKAWEPMEGAGCTTCAFKQLCPAKTGRERPHQTVWQQGDLLWEMTEGEESLRTLPPREPVTAVTGKVRQMTLEDFL